MCGAPTRMASSPRRHSKPASSRKTLGEFPSKFTPDSKCASWNLPENTSGFGYRTASKAGPRQKGFPSFDGASGCARCEHVGLRSGSDDRDTYYRGKSVKYPERHCPLTLKGRSASPERPQRG